MGTILCTIWYSNGWAPFNMGYWDRRTWAKLAQNNSAARAEYFGKYIPNQERLKNKVLQAPASADPSSDQSQSKDSAKFAERISAARREYFGEYIPNQRLKNKVPLRDETFQKTKTTAPRFAGP